MLGTPWYYWPMTSLDQLIIAFDRGLKSVLGPNSSARPYPAAHLEETIISPSERKHAAALMRVNYSGEVSAQALYQGQALTASNDRTKRLLAHSALEETDHLAWCGQRIDELGGRRSLLDPLWYAGSLTLGIAAGLAGNRWNLGFLAETEKQVEEHLKEHLNRLPPGDAKTRAIVQQMAVDEASHRNVARESGAAELPAPVKSVMKFLSRAMTSTAYWV